MFWHIILTERCDSKCKYCYEKSFKEFDNELDKKFKFDFSAPESSKVDVKKLPKMEELIANKTISIKEFDYERDFGPEIIP